MIRFKVGEQYSCVALYGGWHIVTVTERSKDTVTLVYNDDRERKAFVVPVRTQEVGVYDKKLSLIETVETETAEAWKYHSPYAKPGEYDYGYFFAFEGKERLWDRQEWEKYKKGVWVWKI